MGRTDPNQDVVITPQAAACQEAIDKLEDALNARYKRSRYPEVYRDLLYGLWVKARKAQYESI